jgi:hypothetical protein
LQRGRITAAGKPARVTDKEATMTVEERLQAEVRALAALITARVDLDAWLADLLQRRDRQTSSVRRPPCPRPTRRHQLP